MESLGAVSSSRAKPLKEGYVADLTRYGGCRYHFSLPHLLLL